MSKADRVERADRFFHMIVDWRVASAVTIRSLIVLDVPEMPPRSRGTRLERLVTHSVLAHFQEMRSRIWRATCQTWRTNGGGVCRISPYGCVAVA